MVGRPAILADKSNQPGQPLARVNRVERQGFEPAGQLDRVDGRAVWHAIGGTSVTGDDLEPFREAIRPVYRRFVEKGDFSM